MRLRACSATVPCHGCHTPKSSLRESHMLCININIMDRVLMRSWMRIGPQSIQNYVRKKLNSLQIGSKIVAWWVQTPPLSPKLSQKIRGRGFRPHLETKFDLTLNLETIRKECTFCTPKTILLEPNFDLIFKVLEKRIDRNNITSTNHNAK